MSKLAYTFCTSSSSSAERFFGDAAGPDSNHFFTAACCSAVRLAKPLRSSRLSSPRFGFFWHSMWRLRRRCVGRQRICAEELRADKLRAARHDVIV